MFRSGMQKIPKKRGKKVFPLSFLDPSSPRLASGSPRPPNYLWVKEPARLGEPVTSGVSISLPGRAPARLGELPLLPNTHFPINRHAREAKGGFQGSKVERIKRREKKE